MGEREASPGGDASDPKSVALESLRREIRSIRRELQGDPTGRYKGVWERLEAVEKDIEELKDAWEEEQVERRIDKTYRKAFVAGLGALGLLSGIILWVVYRVLQVLAGAGA